MYFFRGLISTQGEVTRKKKQNHALAVRSLAPLGLPRPVSVCERSKGNERLRSGSGSEEAILLASAATGGKTHNGTRLALTPIILRIALPILHSK